MKYYKYLNGNIIERLEATSRNIFDKNAIEITEQDYNSIIKEINEQAIEKAYQEYLKNDGKLSKEEWLEQP